MTSAGLISVDTLENDCLVKVQLILNRVMWSRDRGIVIVIVMVEISEHMEFCSSTTNKNISILP